MAATVDTGEGSRRGCDGDCNGDCVRVKKCAAHRAQTMATAVNQSGVTQLVQFHGVCRSVENPSWFIVNIIRYLI